MAKASKKRRQRNEEVEEKFEEVEETDNSNDSEEISILKEITEMPESDDDSEDEEEDFDDESEEDLFLSEDAEAKIDEMLSAPAIIKQRGDTDYEPTSDYPTANHFLNRVKATKDPSIKETAPEHNPFLILRDKR